MPCAFTHHNDRDELRQIQQSFSASPKFLYFYLSIKIELDRLYPGAELDLYSCCSGNGTYWFMSKRFEYVELNEVGLAYEGEFDAEQFTKAFAMFLDVSNIFPSPILFVGEKMLVDEMEKFLQNRPHNFSGSAHPTLVFYMTEAQMEAVKNVELPQLPDGYEIDVEAAVQNLIVLLQSDSSEDVDDYDESDDDEEETWAEDAVIQGSFTFAMECGPHIDVQVWSADPLKDSETITSHWRHAKKGDIEETRTKLTCLPSSCIRYQGKPVAFEMMSQSGSLNHLFVVEEHRRKGLGQIVELDLSQKAIRFGLKVCKYVEPFNKSLIDSTTRSPYWTRAKQDNGDDLINVYYVLRFE
ncbi:hypothetical protein NECAME_00781 [Necator americanus]|uniref:Uncharacterized protein n=1 Tax=Necator americanus TaxID=51031 RepID=W2SYI2_NECAM|nr:hypothetical protein NECAME_00781 [Necator americanus]ETN73692.1 hypothetical protein NECAME_00781 [Necator americanus]